MQITKKDFFACIYQKVGQQHQYATIYAEEINTLSNSEAAGLLCSEFARNFSIILTIVFSKSVQVDDTAFIFSCELVIS